MNKRILAAALLCCGLPPACAENLALIEYRPGRTEGLITKTPVVMRAIISRPAAPTDTAVLFFRGSPGYARIESVKDKQRNLLPFMRNNEELFLQAGLALVIMDCPTDQWGAAAVHGATRCLDDYRSSKQHADDVRGVMARLRADHGITQFYILGHSFGTLSSRWLAKHLGDEIAGSIHSASMNVPTARGHASSMVNFSHAGIATPVLHVHHGQDGCRSTPYSAVQAYAGENLVTVRGGEPEGDPCEGKHLHSYGGTGPAPVRAMIEWIKTRQVTKFVGNE